MANVETAKCGNSKAYRTTFLDQTERPLPVGKDYNRESEGNGIATMRQMIQKPISEKATRRQLKSLGDGSSKKPFVNAVNN